jgi:hypothetical protein
MRRIFTAVTVVFTLMTVPAFAADGETTPATGGLLISSAAVAAATAAAPAPAPAPGADFSTNVFARVKRPAALPTLYVASAALQGYDAYSTLSAIRAGAVEANPVMQGVVKSPAAFVAVKASVTALSIMAAEKMWKRGNRFGAIGVMVASNVAMGLVAANNARVLASMK